MRYDAEFGKILITCRELVNTARRGISAVLPHDEEEPDTRKMSKRLLKEAIGEFTEEGILYPFDCGEYSFELSARAIKAEKCELWFAMEVDSKPSRPKKEYTAQLRGEGYVAAYAYSIKKGLSRVKLNFIYTNSQTFSYAETCEYADIKKLERFFKKCINTVKVYAKPEIERVTLRVPSMKTLKFPYKFVRDGQDEFVRRTYKSIARGGTLFAAAPTGTGKTVSVLYPAVHAMGEGKRDKTFYFTPKETTANAAIECIELMASAGAVIRAVKLTAKEKRCKNGLLCRNSRLLCDNAKCNKLPDAALALYNLSKSVISNSEIEEISKAYKVCPYELSLTYAELCDVVICDFNYLFDPRVYIRRFFTEGGNYTFLIDEAHNLPERAREMYSAEISFGELVLPALSDLLGEFSKLKKAARDAASLFEEVLFPYVKEEIYTDTDGKKSAFAHIKEIPFELYGIFDNLISVAEEEMYLNFSATDEEKDERLRLLREYYYSVKRFRDVMEDFDCCYEMFIFYKDSSVSVKLYCIDTGKEIRRRLEKGRSAIFFSATLTPLYFYKSMLGGDGTSDTLEVSSPFDSGQLSVSIMDKISTRFSEREDTLSAVCRVIAATVSARRGNYMIFSPSFSYSEALAKAFSSKYPKVKILSQKRNMSQDEKTAFLAEFSKDDKSYLIGFCVMGSIYSEGIDLAGDSLIGAVVVGIGMPALSYEREAMRAYYDEKYEEGKQFAYIYPGMNRVLQAAGRVIRSEEDRGVIVLIDDRFDDPIYKKIIPNLWRGMRFIGDAKELRSSLDKFWEGVN